MHKNPQNLLIDIYIYIDIDRYIFHEKHSAICSREIARVTFSRKRMTKVYRQFAFQANEKIFLEA